MGLDEIRFAVSATAQAEAERVVHAADKHAAERLDAGKARIAQEAEHRYQMEVRVIEEDFARKMLHFSGVASKQLLDKRNECLNGIFTEARREILSRPAEEYGRIMQRLIERAAENAGGKIRVHREEWGVFAPVLEKVNRGRSPETKLALDEASPLTERGGFIFVAADFEVDQTLGTVLDAIRHEMVPEIAAELFPREQ